MVIRGGLLLSVLLLPVVLPSTRYAGLCYPPLHYTTFLPHAHARHIFTGAHHTQHTTAHGTTRRHELQFGSATLWVGYTVGRIACWLATATATATATGRDGNKG